MSRKHPPWVHWHALVIDEEIFESEHMWTPCPFNNFQVEHAVPQEFKGQNLDLSWAPQVTWSFSRAFKVCQRNFASLLVATASCIGGVSTAVSCFVDDPWWLFDDPCHLFWFKDKPRPRIAKAKVFLKFCLSQIIVHLPKVPSENYNATCHSFSFNSTNAPLVLFHSLYLLQG